MKRKITFFVAFFIIAFSIISNAQRYYCVQSPDFTYQGFIVLDYPSLTVLDSVPITYNNGTIAGFNGMAHNPINNTLYVVLKNDGSNARELATIDTLGNATYIGDLECKISSITFGSDGTLYGITGSGGSPEETLFTININTADTTRLLVPPSTGSGDGEALAYNYTNDLVYRYHGDETMQTINPTTLVVDTVFNVFPDYANWSQTLLYDQTANDFKFFDGEIVYTMTPAGALTLIDTLPNGMAFKGVIDVSVIGNTSINNNSTASNISIYPNPSKGIFTVNHSLENAYVSVFDINGKTILESKTNTIDLSDYPAGIYIVKIFSGDQVYTDKLLKK